MLFFIFFYNGDNDIDFLKNHDDFSYKIAADGLRFQDFDFFKEIYISYDYRKKLVGNRFKDNSKEEIDFLLTATFDNVTIACGANQLHFFNDFESLNDEDIKRLSNQWWIYWIDYWKSKKTDKNKYKYDPACEAITFYKD